MVQKEQAERSRQRLEQKVKENELRQQLAAKKDRQESIDLVAAVKVRCNGHRFRVFARWGVAAFVYPGMGSVVMLSLPTASESTPC